MEQILDEAWADQEVQRVLLNHLSELCLSHRGYAIIMAHGINLKGDIKMPQHKLYKDDDGSVHEVVESVTLTLDEIDARIEKAQAHVQHLQDLRAAFVAFSGEGADSAAPADATPPAPAAGGVELTVTPGDQAAPAADGTPVPANADQGQVPPAPAVDGPAADTAAVNNGQVNPADATNPTPAVPEQPIIGA